MTGSILWKLILSVALIGSALYFVFPLEDTPFPEYVNDLATNPPEVEEALEQGEADVLTWEDIDTRANARIESGQSDSYFLALRDLSREEKLDLSPYFAEINVRDIANLQRRNDTLLRVLLDRSQGKVKPGLDLSGGVSITYRASEDGLSDEDLEREAQLEQAVGVLTSRVDGLGVAEPVIRRKGENFIEVQLPGVSTAENPGVVDEIAKAARLEFSLVHRTIRPPQPAPVGFREMILEDEDRTTGQITEEALYVKRIPEMTGKAISQARPQINEIGGYEIGIDFTSEGSDQFARLTRQIFDEDQRTGGRGLIATILDGKLISAYGVNEPITGGAARITGQFSQREAIELSSALNNPLEFGLEPIEIYEVGPQLARDARIKSIEAAILGGALVILFMLAYYQFAGLIAVISVTCAMALVMGTLASFEATITLPGVAALVLTIGMAVDANILIFERMREELREGKSLRNALLAGYNKVLSTIVDANVTTSITALILLWLGTGPVQGFGITLFVGIVASVFCALIVSRFLLEILVSTGIMKAALKLNLFRFEGIPFLNYSRPAFMTSWAVVLIGIVIFVVKIDDVFGIDFTGGSEITIAFDERVSTGQIDEVVAEIGIREVNHFYQTALDGGSEFLRLQTEVGDGDVLLAALQETYPEANLSLVSETTIGATVGENVQRSAILSVTLALLAMLVYVALRFEMGYGVGAVVATIHDILMTIGVFVLLGGQFTAPMVAAILMVVGYSINDTIVVFDRIREELSLNPGMNLRKVVHLAINRTLSRTLLTSISTLLATLSLLIFAAGVITDFALVFLIGILTGTFSSIFIASPVFYWWHKGDRRHVEERKDVLPKYEWETGTKTAQPTSGG